MPKNATSKSNGAFLIHNVHLSVAGIEGKKFLQKADMTIVIMFWSTFKSLHRFPVKNINFS